MGILEILLLGLALSADAFAVTVSNSFVYRGERRSRLALMPVFFGAFQALMPLLGYHLGGLAAELIDACSGIVTLAILGLIGGNMVREGVTALRHAKEEESESALDSGSGSSLDHGPDPDRLTVGVLLAQAVATAIDAFAVGVSLRAQSVDIALSVVIIGLTTAACCVVALAIGRRVGRLLGDRAQIVGGCVLIAIGLKALLR